MRNFNTITKSYPVKRDAKERIGDFSPIYRNFDEAEAKAQASRCIQCPIDILRGLKSEFSFCRTGCPLNNNITRWLKSTYEGHVEEAFALSNEHSPFPEILGRVCPKKGLCESACTLEKSEHHAVSIGNIEIFLNEKAFSEGAVPTYGETQNRKFKVAIVGSGPAGMSCATFLLRAGIGVEIFEKEDRLGGLLTYGIPNFKLDKDIIARRVQWMVDAGLGVHVNTKVGKDISMKELKEKFDCIFLGMGAPRGRSAGLENEHANGVYQVMEVLTQTQKNLFNHKTHNPMLEGKDVVVIGGGDSAMDATRTAIRSQAKSVTCIYRRDEASMPGSPAEVQNAKEEGVKFLFNHLPKHIVVDKENTVVGLEIVETQMSHQDNRLKILEESKSLMKTDIIILALGFNNKRFDFYSDLELDFGKANEILVDHNQETSHASIYAGGDVVRGAHLVVTAALDGRTAAEAIARKLGVIVDEKLYM